MSERLIALAEEHCGEMSYDAPDHPNSFTFDRRELKAFAAALSQPHAEQPSQFDIDAVRNQLAPSVWALAAFDRILAAQPHASEQVAAPEPITIEAVATVGRDGGLDWLIEGGPGALEPGETLMICAERLTDNTGSGEVYRAPHAPAPVQAASTEPVGYVNRKQWPPKDRAFAASVGRVFEDDVPLYATPAPVAAPAPVPPLQGAEAPSEGQMQEWRDKAADYDRLAGIARNRRRVLEEIAGSKPLTATPQQFADHLKRLATKACKDYTFDGNEGAAAGEQEKAAPVPAEPVAEALSDARLLLEVLKRSVWSEEDRNETEWQEAASCKRISRVCKALLDGWQHVKGTQAKVPHFWCNKCGYYGLSSAHERCNYLAAPVDQVAKGGA